MTVTVVPPVAYNQTAGSQVAFPSLTLLMATTPAAHLTAGDRCSLRQLADTAEECVSADLDPFTLNAIRSHLSTAVGSAAAAGTDQGLAVQVSPRRCRSVLLPFTPRPLVIVESSDATQAYTVWVDADFVRKATAIMVAGDVDIATAAPLWDGLAEAIDTGPDQVVIDPADLGFIASSDADVSARIIQTPPPGPASPLTVPRHRRPQGVRAVTSPTSQDTHRTGPPNGFSVDWQLPPTGAAL
jgi:hypothetical protein